MDRVSKLIKEIVPLEEEARERKTDLRSDIERYFELIEKLSQMHLKRSRKEEVLCFAGPDEFNKNHINFPERIKTQSELFGIASRYKIPWTNDI